MSEQPVRILCDVEGYGEFWIEYDVSTWTIEDFVTIPLQSAFGAVFNYVAKYVVAWNIIGDDGAIVPCPVRGAPWEMWQQSLGQIGPKTSRDIYVWLWSSVLAALTVASTPQPKSDAGGQGHSSG